MPVDEIYFRVGNEEGNPKVRGFCKEKWRPVSVIQFFTFSTENLTSASLSLLFAPPSPLLPSIISSFGIFVLYSRIKILPSTVSVHKDLAAVWTINHVTISKIGILGVRIWTVLVVSAND